MWTVHDQNFDKITFPFHLSRAFIEID